MDLDEESSKKEQDPDQKQSENLDPLIGAFRQILQYANKDRRKPDDGEEEREKDDAEAFVNGNTKGTPEIKKESPSKPLEENRKEDEKDGLEGKVKVRISRLGSADTKLLEENEKQEELSGVSSANNRLKKAGKKIEDIIKKKLKKAGVDIGGMSLGNRFLFASSFLPVTLYYEIKIKENNCPVKNRVFGMNILNNPMLNLSPFQVLPCL